MARKPKTTTGTEVVDWEAQMAAQAQIAADAQRATGGGGKFFSMRAGQLSFDDTALPGNQMAVIVIASTLENSYYDGPYDPNTPASPKCFAFGTEEADMEPHEAVDNDPYFERQAQQCSGCPQNEWGSAETGKGKACKNVQRLAVIPAGQYKAKGTGRNVTYELELYDDPEQFKKAEVAFLKLPVMSVKNFGKYVKQVAAEMGRPPHGVITNIYLEPDPKSQFRVMFEVIDKVDNDLLPIIMPRHTTEQGDIGFPYSPPKEEEAAPTKASRTNKLSGKAKGRK